MIILLLCVAAVLADANVTCTLNVRFAAAPTNDARFKPPTLVTNLTESLKHSVKSCDQLAIANSTSCPQQVDNFSSFFLQHMDEDCLFLNVFAPAQVNAPLPVSVFFYGGSFTSGSISVPLYDGTAIVARKNNTVVVTANYRLGALGFLSLPALLRESNTTGNYGLLDQIGALRWVQANIANFGGDPTRVTIFGESAGGASVCALIASPLAEGLFQGAIMESGLCQDASSLNVTETVSLALASQLSCGPFDLQCLRSVPWHTLAAAQTQASPVQQRMVTPWAPSVDNAVLFATPLETLLAGKAIKSLQRVLIGTNANETNTFGFAVPSGMNLTIAQLFNQLLTVFNKTQAEARTLIKLYLPPTGIRSGPLYASPASLALQSMVTDFIFTCPSLLAADALSKIGVQTFSYLFAKVPSCIFDNIPPMMLPILGASHSFELPFVFDTNPSQKCHRDAADKEVALRMVDYWQSIVQGNAPTTSLANGIAQWPQYNSQTRQTGWLDAPSDSVVSNWRVNHCAAIGIKI